MNGKQRVVMWISVVALAVTVTSPIFANTDRMAKANASDKLEMEAPITKININTATIDQLSQLPGIGLKRAHAIIDYRLAHGSFNKVQELVNIRGVSQKFVTKYQDYFTVG